MTGQGQLEIRNCALDRGGRRLFSHLSVTLEAGQAAFVTGPNGAGKSSLMRMVAGLIAPVQGTLSVSGGIALSAEALALDPALPLAEALGFWAALDGRGRDAVDAALQALGVPHLAPVPVRMLSTGQRKRASLARVMASGAALWLLDEPANGLDVAAIPLLEEAIARHRAAGGLVLVATHQPITIPEAQRVEIGA